MVKIRVVLPVCLSVLFALLSCQGKKANSSKYSVVGLKKDDSTFLALKDTAQSYINVFIDSIRIHGMDKRFRFAIKSDFIENGVHEHMWSQVNLYQNGKFDGIFADSAYEIKKIKAGDIVSIPESSIEDWSIYDSKRNVRVGDFSEKYLNSKQSTSGN